MSGHCSHVVLIAAVYCLVAASTSRAADPDLPNNANDIQRETANEVDSIKQIMSEECRGVYSGRCMKLGLLKLLSRAGSYRLTGGLTVTAEAVSPPTGAELDLSEPGRLDRLLVRSLSQYLGSMSLNVRVMDKDAPMKLAQAYFGDSSATGRRKDKNGGALAAMGLMSGGMMLALGMSALAAMAGKALMASMLALMLAAISALKGGGDEKTTTYEVISKPVVSHVHSHSSEVQHGHHGGHHYRKRRSLFGQDLAFARQIPQTTDL